MSVVTITPKQLYELNLSGAKLQLIDVRTPVEFSQAHVSFAQNIPLDQISSTAPSGEMMNTAEPLYVICQSGARGKKACEKLGGVGKRTVINVEGGTSAWAACGLPLTRGASRMSLERQVRIAAGLLVLVGITLGYFVHPFGFLLSAFVGAGLVFAGLTDTCGMGLLLSKMPWNQVSPGEMPPTTCSLE